MHVVVLERQKRDLKIHHNQEWLALGLFYSSQIFLWPVKANGKRGSMVSSSRSVGPKQLKLLKTHMVVYHGDQLETSDREAAEGLESREPQMFY